MNKNVKYLAIILPLLTLIVWVIWIFVAPQLKQQILDFASQIFEKRIHPEKKRRSVTRNRK